MFRLYDRIIDLELHYVAEEPVTLRTLNPYLRTTHEVQKKLNITCPRNGKKPKITFTYKRVPGNVVYQADITVHNLYMQIDSIKVDEIIVNAGYSSGYGMNMENFHCQVFNSFTPEPGPDGYTVFQCIIAQADVQLLEARSYVLQIYNQPQSWSVRDVFNEISIGIGMARIVFASDDLMNERFTEKEITPQFYSTGYALLGAFLEKVNVIASQKYGHSVEIGIFDNNIYLMEYDSQGNIIADVKEVNRRFVKLDLVTSVDWNAGTITVVAPWNPHVKPESIVSISPNFYKGSYALPNDIARTAAQRDANDLYKVITQEVSFSTEGTTNSMTLMAVPIKYTGDTELPEKLKNDAKDMYNVVQQQVSDTSTLIKLGDGGTQAQELDNSQEAKDISQLSLNSNSIYYVVQKGDTLSQIVTDRFQCEQLRGKVRHTEKVIPACTTWYPIIMALTNAKVLQGRKGYRIDMKSPDNIHEGDWLAIPQPATWKSLWQNQKSTVVGVCNTVIKYYEELGKNAWVKDLYDVIDIFENGVVL